MARRRTSMGRQTIQIRRIVNDDKRQVCFSKRRAGLFNKASQLAILCGAEVAAVVISPAGRAFSFGHPSVDAVIHRFDPTGLGAGLGGGADDAEEENRQLAEVNRRYGELRARLDAEKARKERAEAAMAKEIAAASPLAAWLGADVRDLGKEELMLYAAVLQEVQTAVTARANREIQDALNHRRAMAAARARALSSANNNNQAVLQSPPQQFLLANNNNNQVLQSPAQQLLNANNGAVGFLYPFGAGSAYNNGTEMEMQIHQMLTAMTSPPGFAGFFPGPY